MRKIKYSFLICLIIFAFTSCKKTSNNTSTVNNTGSSNSTISASNATSYYGIFYTGKNQAIVGGVLQAPNYNLSGAYFSSSPVFFPDGSKVVTVDTVKANGRTLIYQSFDNMYEDTSGYSTGGNHLPFTFPITWHVVGKNGIPSFTYLDNTPFASYTGYNAIPDTLNRAGFTFSLSGVSNVDGISALMDDGSFGHYSTSVILGSNATSVTFTASDMTQLSATNAGNISITFNKKNIENVYGKAMSFQSTYIFSKKISIK